MSDPYDAGWRELARRERWAAIGIVAYVLGGVIGVSLLDRWMSVHVGPGAGVLAVLPWAIFAIATIGWRALSPCPRCGKHFFVRGLYGNAFARRCLNCTLPLWQRSTEERAE